MKLWLRWAGVLLLCALFVRAGFWQLDRAEQKESELASVGAVLLDRSPQPLADAIQAPPAWVELHGRFEDHPPLRLDQQQRQGRVGVQVYRLFRTIEGESLWVDVGWRPLPAERSLPAEPALPEQIVVLSGLLTPPPASGLPIGPDLTPAGDGGWLALRLSPQALATARMPPTVASAAISAKPPQALDRLVLRLDPAMALGHARDLDLLVNTLPPEKHRGYALQWFGFAIGLFLLSLYLQLRRP